MTSRRRCSARPALHKGMTKSTYGTGCFMLVNTGHEIVSSHHRLLTTPAYRLGGETTYALEGSIFVAGAAVKWLRDGLGVIADAAETDSLATRVPDSHGVYMVPAFVGLGAPYWDPDARAAIFGLTLDASAAHLARAALEAVAYQTLDLVDAMAGDGAAGAETIRIDGGMAANEWLCQFLADILEVPVERPRESRNDRARRCLPRRPCDRGVGRSRCAGANLEASRSVRARHAGSGPRTPHRRLAKGCRENA